MKEAWVTDEHFTCSCGGLITLDHRGYAFCSECAMIYNDGEVKSEPKKYSKKDKTIMKSRFVRAIKAL